MKPTNLIIALLALLLTSCYSTMKVRVDSLNMPAFKATYLYSAERTNSIERNVRYLVSPGFTAKVTQLIADLNTFIDTSGVIPTEDAADLKKELDATSKNVMNDLLTTGTKTLVSATKFRNTAASPDLEQFENDVSAFTVAFFQLVRFNEYAKQFEEKAGIPLDEGTDALLHDVSASIDAIKSEFGQSILNDPAASIIAALPEQYWSKYDKKVNLSISSGDINQTSLGNINKYVRKKPNRYNTTVARTRMGNSDIAIRMAAPGEFIVKGVRVDADEAVRNSFKVVSQGIKYLAYASGVPVVESANTPKKSITPLLDSLAQTDRDLHQAREQYQRATDAFLAVLINAAPDLQARTNRAGMTPQEIRDSAVARIKNAYSIYKDIVNK